MHIKSITSRIKFDLSASDITVKRNINRIQAIADAIEQKFERVNQPEKIKLKHMQFIRNQWYQSQEFSEATIKDYNRSMSIMVSALGRNHWLAPLELKQDSTKGGRPKIAQIVRSKRR